jgi:predicted RNA-binding protein with EMAP domain
MGEERRLSLQEQVSDLHEKIAELRGDLNASISQGAEILELYDSIKILIKILAALQRMAVGTTQIAAALALVWVAWKYIVTAAITGTKPP